MSQQERFIGPTHVGDQIPTRFLEDVKSDNFHDIGYTETNSITAIMTTSKSSGLVQR